MWGDRRSFVHLNGCTHIEKWDTELHHRRVRCILFCVNVGDSYYYCYYDCGAQGHNFHLGLSQSGPWTRNRGYFLRHNLDLAGIRCGREILSN